MSDVLLLCKSISQKAGFDSAWESICQSVVDAESSSNSVHDDRYVCEQICTTTELTGKKINNCFDQCSQIYLGRDSERSSPGISVYYGQHRARWTGINWMLEIGGGKVILIPGNDRNGITDITVSFVNHGYMCDVRLPSQMPVGSMVQISNIFNPPIYAKVVKDGELPKVELGIEKPSEQFLQREKKLNEFKNWRFSLMSFVAAMNMSVVNAGNNMTHATFDESGSVYGLGIDVGSAFFDEKGKNLFGMGFLVYFNDAHAFGSDSMHFQQVTVALKSFLEIPLMQNLIITPTLGAGFSKGWTVDNVDTVIAKVNNHDVHAGLVLNDPISLALTAKVGLEYYFIENVAFQGGVFGFLSTTGPLGIHTSDDIIFLRNNQIIGGAWVALALKL